MNQSMKEVIPCCSKDTVGKRREKGTVMSFDPETKDGLITPDTYFPGSDSVSILYFRSAYLSSAKDSGIKKGDKVTYMYPFSRTVQGFFINEARDIQLMDNG